MFNSETGAQFFFKGAVYLPVPKGGTATTDYYVDVGQNRATWTKDIKNFKELGINAVRIRHLDSTKDHSTFMKDMQSAGIYVLVDIDPEQQFNSDPPVYNMDLWSDVQQLIDEFTKYSNTLAFVAFQEMITVGKKLKVAPYAKALIRDMKRYMRDIAGVRQVPVTFASASMKEGVYSYSNIINYYSCGPQWEAADIAGMNMQWWDHGSDPDKSGYTVLWQNLKPYSKPFIFTEFSTVTSKNNNGKCPCFERTFAQVKNMFDPQGGGKCLTGGLVFEYSDESENNPNDPTDISVNRGLVQNDATRTRKPDFTILSLKYRFTNYPPGLNMSTYTPSLSPPPCPTGGAWDSIADLPPAPFDASSSTAATGGPTPAPGGLSKGEIIALGVGGGVVGLCVVGCFIGYLRKKKSNEDYDAF